MAATITELNDRCQALVSELLGSITDLQDEVEELNKELAKLKLGCIEHPENYTCMGYNLKDLVALAYKCQNCGLTDYDLRKVAEDFSLALGIVYKEQTKAMTRLFSGMGERMNNYGTET